MRESTAVKVKCKECNKDMIANAVHSSLFAVTCDKCILKKAGVSKFPEPPNRNNVLRIKGDGHAEVGF